jgi:hypothetical protein
VWRRGALVDVMVIPRELDDAAKWPGHPAAPAG